MRSVWKGESDRSGICERENIPIFLYKIARRNLFLPLYSGSPPSSVPSYSILVLTPHPLYSDRTTHHLPLLVFLLSTFSLSDDEVSAINSIWMVQGNESRKVYY